MKCRQADELMMNYLDGILSKDKAYQLNQHLQQCDACVETFYAYEQIKKELHQMNIVEAPIGFTEQVMGRIEEIKPQYDLQKEMPMENITGIVWGIFSILFGVGVLLVIYQQEILSFLLSYPYTSSWIGQFIPTFDLLTQYLQQLQKNMSGIIVSIRQIVENGKTLLALILVALGMVQYRIYRKEKVEV